ncbi:MAG: hypothetical protein HY645_04185 [Acidobacteria bacterium]|nr:hypothetical protein [Acidobacteriota bacterium]
MTEPALIVLVVSVFLLGFGVASLIARRRQHRRHGVSVGAPAFPAHAPAQDSPASFLADLKKREELIELGVEIEPPLAKQRVFSSDQVIDVEPVEVQGDRAD